MSKKVTRFEENTLFIENEEVKEEFLKEYNKMKKYNIKMKKSLEELLNKEVEVRVFVNFYEVKTPT